MNGQSFEAYEITSLKIFIIFEKVVQFYEDE